MQHNIEGFRLSRQQKRLWLLRDVEAVQVRCIIRIEGILDGAKLKTAVQQLVERHAILHTTFHNLPSKRLPIQVIAQQSDFMWDEVDWRGYNSEQQTHEIESFLSLTKDLSSQMREGPSVSFSLATLSPDEHMLLLSLPALCADTYTLERLTQELCDAYATSQEGNADEEIVQYIQYAEWQRDLCESIDEDAKAGRAYWHRKHLPEASAMTHPFRVPEHIPSGFQPQTLISAVPAALIKQLEALALHYQLSFPSLCLAAWYTLLWRLKGGQEISVGYVYNGREAEELQTTLGPFAETLPNRLRFRKEMPFSEVWIQIEDDISDSREWQEYFSRETNGEEREASPSFTPISFEYEKRLSYRSAENAVFSLYRRHVYFDTFALKLYWVDRDGAVTTEIHYDFLQLSADTIRYLPAQYLTLLQSIAKNAETSVNRLEIVSEDERQLLTGLYKRDHAFDNQRCIHTLFEEQLRRVPNNIAIVFENQRLTYAQLDARANQLAHYLQKKGVGPDILVGVSVKRSIDMVIGLLGVLKAGGAYVPIDYNQPNSRLVLLLKDTQAPVLLSQHEFIKQFAGCDSEIICLDTDWDKIAQESNEAVQSGVISSNLAYVLFTSGSTGKPKGVAIEHRQLVSYTCGVQESVSFPPDASFAMVSTFTADLGNTMLFPALSTGGCLHVLSEERASNPALLADYFSLYAIDALKIAPSHLRTLLASSVYPERLLPKERLILGGEASDKNWVEGVQELSPDCTIFNHYGPTETTVGVLVHQVTLDGANSNGNILPLSKPLPAAQIYLLDASMQPVPIGAQGEIYIGGESVARGYFKETTLTAEKFLPNPYGKNAGARLYRTGDLACYQSDGSIIFLGRVDDQVKYHGHRMELDSLRHIMLQHPEVKDSVAIVDKGIHGKELLVVYYASKQELDQRQLRSFLAEHIPQELLPNIFVHLHKLPLTSNGKIDKRALPSFEDTDQRRNQSYAAPRTSIEQIIAEVWSRFLGIKEIGIHDNFFELGGDSILGIQIIAAAKRMGIDITLKQLFQQQTLAQLASVANLGPVIYAEQEVVSGSVALTPIQRWFFEQRLPQPGQWSVVVHLKIQEPVDFRDAEQVLEKILLHHDALRSRFVEDEEGWHSFIAPPDINIPLDLLDISDMDRSEQPLYIDSEMGRLQASLDLARGPILRAALVKVGHGEPDHLLMAVHRLVIDGVSWRILLEQFQVSFEQMKQGVAVDFPPKTTSYKYWAEKLSAYAQSENLLLQFDYWRTALPEYIPALPVDFSPQKDVWALEQAVSVALTAEETQALLQEVSAAYHTEINDVLLTALLCACLPWTGQAKLLINLEGHGREELFDDVDLSRTVGWFTAIFPVLLETSPGATVLETLKRVKETLRQIPQRGSGYGLLRYLAEDLTLRQAMHALPQAELLFRYAGQFHHTDGGSFVPVDQQEPLLTRRYRLMVISGTVSDRLQVSWFYDKDMYSHETIEHLAQNFLEALRSLVAQSRVPQSGEHGYIPSDFPHVNLNQQKLDNLLKKLSRN